MFLLPQVFVTKEDLMELKELKTLQPHLHHHMRPM